MNFDEMIRDALEDSTKDIGDISSDELMGLLRGRRGDDGPLREASSRDRDRSTRKWALVAAFLVMVIAGALSAALATRGPESRQVATTPANETGFDGWGSGWHKIDRGPVPALISASMVWFEDHLIVAGAWWDDSSEDTNSPSEGIWVYDPVDRAWSTVPSPDFHGVSLVAAGPRLVAVGTSQPTDVYSPTSPVFHDRWATWSIDDKTWTEQPAMPAVAKDKAPVFGLNAVRGSDLLVWTGKAVLDMTRGTALDPATGRIRSLDLPDGVSLLGGSSTRPVWTGERVVWPGDPIWGASGYSWGPSGQDIDEIPPPFAESVLTLGDSHRFASDVFVVGGDTIVISAVEPHADETQVYAFRLGSGTKRWEPIAAVPSIAGEGCFSGATSTVDDLLLVSCERDVAPDTAVLLRAGKWFDVSPMAVDGAPTKKQQHLVMSGAGRSVVVWSTADVLTEPPVLSVPVKKGASDPWAAVWVPEPTSQMTPAAVKLSGPEGPGACPVDELLDLTESLPEMFDTGPERGAGGIGGTEETCARWWGVSDSPGVHITQIPGSSYFPLVTTNPDGTVVIDNVLGTEGDYRWGEIHEGYGVEYKDPLEWSLLIFGLDKEQVKELVDRLAARE